MTTRQTWTRRQFSQAVTASAGVALAHNTFALPAAEPRGFAFISSRTDVPDGGTIEVFQVSGSTWRHAQSVRGASPAHLLVHPTLPILYAVHDVPLWQYLPRGAVSAYAFDRHTGQLSLLGTQPLSLAATHPRHATLTANAGHLLVAAEHGGIYNLLPIATDGSLLAVSAIRKEFGWVDNDGIAKLASPRAVALHPDGSLLAADAGQECLTRFLLQRDSLAPCSQVRVHAGQGPSMLAVAPRGSNLYALNIAGDAISVHALAKNGPDRISPALQTYVVAKSAKSMRVAPGGRYLVSAAHNVTEILRIHPIDGSLTAHSRLRGTGETSLCFSMDGQRMLGLDAASGNVYTTAFEPIQGIAGRPEVVARVAGCLSLACSTGA